MVRIKLKYVVEDQDRHGNIRHYFRRKGQPKIRLRGIPGSDEFMEAYRAALANAEKPHNNAICEQLPVLLATFA